MTERKTAVVKEAFDRYGAKQSSSKKATELIKAKESLKLIGRVKPFCYSKSVKLGVVCVDQTTASLLALMPGVEYDGSRTVTYTATDYLEVNKTFVSMVACAESLIAIGGKDSDPCVIE